MAQGDRLLGSYSPRPNHNAAPGTRMSTWLSANLRIGAKSRKQSEELVGHVSLFPFLLLRLIFMVSLLSFSFLFNPLTQSLSDILTSFSFTLSFCSASSLAKRVFPRCLKHMQTACLEHKSTLAGKIQAGVFSANLNALDQPVDSKAQRAREE